MSQVIQCPQCHQGNELGRMFCTRCGTKLNMEQVTHGGAAFDLTTFLRGTIRVVIFMVMLVLVLLLIWPATPAGKRGDEQELAALLGQRVALKQAIQRGQEAKCELTETALNAYLAASLKAARSNEETAASWMMNLAELNVGFKSYAVKVTALAHWGPVSITWQVSGTPKIIGNRFQLDVKSGRIGHLGVPGGAGWMGSRMAVLFNRWLADQELLNALSSVTLDNGSATLVTRAGAMAKE